MPSRKYPELNDLNWLLEKYINKKMSTLSIAEILGVKSANSVRQALLRNGFDLRSARDAIELNRPKDGFFLNDNNRSVLEGSLMGDASLRSYNIESDNSFPYFVKKNKNYDHVQYVAKIIFGNNWKSRIREEYSKEGHKCYILRSYTHRFLKEFQNEWYPKNNDYKKVIPDNLTVTPDFLLHWFMDDGNSYERKRDYPKHWKQRKKQVVLTFCTECFSKENQSFFVDKVNREFDLDMVVRKYNQGTGWRMYIPQSKTNNFFNIIGECPVSSMEYKWKRV